MKATGHSGRYLPGEVLNFVWHVDFKKYYYLKFYVWGKKSTKALKLEMAEYRETNHVSEKNSSESTRSSYIKDLLWVFFFFCTLVHPLKLPGMAALALLLLVGASWERSLNNCVSGYGPCFPVLSLTVATDCSTFAFLSVQESNSDSVDEIALFK